MEFDCQEIKELVS